MTIIKRCDNDLLECLYEEGIRSNFPIILKCSEALKLLNIKKDVPIVMNQSKSTLNENVQFYKPISRML